MGFEKFIMTFICYHRIQNSFTQPLNQWTTREILTFFLKANPIVAHILTPASLNTWSLKAARESRKIVVGCVPGKFPMF